MKINEIIDRIRLPFRKEKELYLSLYEIIGCYPRNISYYKQALLHKSMSRRNEKGRPVNNERLEFLGDAVLGAVVADIAFRHFEGKREGFLTNTRSKIVQRETLGRLAQEMGLTNLIKSNGRISSHNSYMGGNAFEAMVGALYLDRGYNACMQFMEKRILKELLNIDKVAYKEVNFKSKLIEWSQKNRVKIQFIQTGQDDEEGSPKFKYQVIIEDIKAENGSGYSKKEAQQQAAKLTLQRLRKEPQFIDAVFAAKASRTKLEEQPVQNVPDTNPLKDDFIVRKGAERGKSSEKKPIEDNAPVEYFKEDKPISIPQKPKELEKVRSEEYDFSDINVSPSDPSREDIIAAAEAAAFAEE